MYQNCPTCNATGKFKRKICPVCFGERIINEEDGLPPSRHYIPPFSPYVPLWPTVPQYPWEYPIITYGDHTGVTSNTVTNKMPQILSHNTPITN